MTEKTLTSGGDQPRKPRIATAWLGGCSGCHMSFLDIDERLLDLARLADIVYSPILDVKEFPENVDVAFVEGAVANEDHLAMIRKIRERTKILVAMGDCAVTGNVTAIRNGIPLQIILRTSYVDRSTHGVGLPNDPGIVPALLPRVEPLHRVVRVDAYLPGCPPSADEIWSAAIKILTGEPFAAVGAGHKFG